MEHSKKTKPPFNIDFYYNFYIKIGLNGPVKTKTSLLKYLHISLVVYVLLKAGILSPAKSI